MSRIGPATFATASHTPATKPNPRPEGEGHPLPRRAGAAADGVEIEVEKDHARQYEEKRLRGHGKEDARPEPGPERSGERQEPVFPHDRREGNAAARRDYRQQERDRREQRDRGLDVDRERHERSGDDRKAEAERAVAEARDETGERDERDHGGAELGAHAPGSRKRWHESSDAYAARASSSKQTRTATIR